MIIHTTQAAFVFKQKTILGPTNSQNFREKAKSNHKGDDSN